MIPVQNSVKIMKSLSAILVNSFYIVFGFILIGLLFYNRIIRERLPKVLYLFSPEFNYALFFIMITWIIISLNVIYFSIKVIYNIPITQNFMTKYFIKISEFVSTSLYKVHELLGLLTPNLYDYISSFCWNFYLLFHNTREDFFSIISYFIRIIIVFIFIYDVFWNFKLDYFYNSLILLVIPIIKKVIFFVLRDFITNIDLTLKPLVITHVADDNYVISRAKGYEHLTNNELNYYIQEYTRCAKIQGYLDEHRAYADYYLFRVNLVIYPLYLFGWFFVIVKNIYLFI